MDRSPEDVFFIGYEHGDEQAEGADRRGEQCGSID